MEDKNNYTVDVKVNEEFLVDPDDRIFIRMEVLLKGNNIDSLSFGSNHEIVNKELHSALDQFQFWIDQNLENSEIINKLHELDRLQYGQNLVCSEIGQAIAKLYQQLQTRNNN